ncbi:MAG: hypothetical protein JWN86_1970 [Planctomycetota bacterium]|nr:hypothetical protein [Planctomycetota bacterium]
MSRDRQGRHRSGRRAFRPGLDDRTCGQLEGRQLLSTVSIFNNHDDPVFHVQKNIQYHTAFGGKIAKIRDTDLELYNVVLTGTGSVRAKPMSGGRVMLIVDGSDASTVISINPESRQFRKGTAHLYPPGATLGDHILHVGAIKVRTGVISQILGYRTADLSGPINLPGASAVDRIAFIAYKPGAAITTGGDLNTLDSFTDMNLAGGPGIQVGRDLNWVNIGGNLTVSDGSSLSVARDVGLTLQPAKGTDPGGAGGLVGGNVNIAPGGAFTIGRALQSTFLVQGRTDGASRITIPFGAANYVSRGGIFP